MNDNLEEKYYKLIENNVNIGKSSDGKEFLILLSGLAVICFCIFVFSDIFSGFVIDNMSDKTQVKLENMLSGNNNNIVNKNQQKMQFLEEIKPKIISMDKKLQGKSNFNLYEIDEKIVNAYVQPNGDIYLTTGLLDKVDDKKVLTFILAHEMGHYAHRDHLKALGRELTIATLLSFITMGHKDISSTVNGFSSINNIHHSQKQEENADIYANHVMYRLYGNNNGAVEFFKFLQKEEKLPEFIYYFSTHPSNERRLYIIRNNR